MTSITATNRVCAWLAGSLLCSCAFTEQHMPITMSNANVVAVLNTIDQIEVDAGELGTHKAASQKVRAFASRLAHEHTSSMKE
jgi:predicted outer membrane protein